MLVCGRKQLAMTKYNNNKNNKNNSNNNNLEQCNSNNNINNNNIDNDVNNNRYRTTTVIAIIIKVETILLFKQRFLKQLNKKQQLCLLSHSFFGNCNFY